MSVFYTIVPPEVLFAPSPKAAPSLWRHRGRLMYVEEDQMGSATVVRLLSTEPRDFLDPTLAPGAQVSVGPGTERLESSRA